MNEFCKLWKFYWDCGRAGSVEGLFIATEREINFFLGKKVYFGEILGKHSEITGILEEGDFTEIKLPQEYIEELYKVSNNGVLCGYNPLEYLQEE